jgi:hypothetical protein
MAFSETRKKKTHLENHENLGNRYQHPKDQGGPYNPYCVVQMHQLLSNKQHELQEVEPVIFKKFEH